MRHVDALRAELTRHGLGDRPQPRLRSCKGSEGRARAERRGGAGEDHRAAPERRQAASGLVLSVSKDEGTRLEARGQS